MRAQPRFEQNEKITLAEYLKLEEENHQRYEYHDGYVYAMSGGTIPHSLIGTNVTSEIYIALKGKPCKPINNDMKLWLEEKNRYVYPDCMIVCGKFELSDDHKDAITNPVVIVEVLSESTEVYDRGSKFMEYRKISSLRHYVLISQNKPQIEIYSRREDKKEDIEQLENDKNSTSLWKITTLEGLDKILSLVLTSHPNKEEKIQITLKDIYEDVEFEKLEE